MLQIGCHWVLPGKSQAYCGPAGVFVAAQADDGLARSLTEGKEHTAQLIEQLKAEGISCAFIDMRGERLRVTMLGGMKARAWTSWGECYEWKAPVWAWEAQISQWQSIDLICDAHAGEHEADAHEISWIPWDPGQRCVQAGAVRLGFPRSENKSGACAAVVDVLEGTGNRYGGDGERHSEKKRWEGSILRARDAERWESGGERGGSIDEAGERRAENRVKAEGSGVLVGWGAWGELPAQWPPKSDSNC